MLFAKDRSDDVSSTKVEIDDDLAKSFFAVHRVMDKKYLTPKRFLTLLEAYRQVYVSKQQTVGKRQQHLKSGVAKLSEAQKVVDDLKRNAEIKQKELGVKQREADEALKQITKSMVVRRIHRSVSLSRNIACHFRMLEHKKVKWNNWL
jgi:polyhydroxyalkanoate synthesis regulator phasin